MKQWKVWGKKLFRLTRMCHSWTVSLPWLDRHLIGVWCLDGGGRSRTWSRWPSHKPSRRYSWQCIGCMRCSSTPWYTPTAPQHCHPVSSTLPVIPTAEPWSRFGIIKSTTLNLHCSPRINALIINAEYVDDQLHNNVNSFISWPNNLYEFKRRELENGESCVGLVWGELLSFFNGLARSFDHGGFSVFDQC